MAKKDKNKTCDDLIDEICQNARSDREIITGYLTSIKTQDISKAHDPLVAAELAVSLAENLSKLVDSLTKANAQLVLAASLKARRERKTGDKEELTPEEKAELAGVIEDVN